MPAIRAAALTDIGRVRRQNEDRFVCDEQAMLFGVADGVGGLPGGAEAAELAIQEIREGFSAGGGGAEVNLSQLAQRANSAVSALGLKISPAMGIGTTLTVGSIAKGAMKLAHVGDSRCYMARKTEFLRLTEDHSVENEARLRRARGEAVYYHDTNRNALTRCIGQPTRVDVDVISRPLATGDRYLFCTDGVTRVLPDPDLAQLVMKPADPASALRQIVDAVLARGGPDNATAVLVFIDEV
jgi:protein phosphatase